MRHISIFAFSALLSISTGKIGYLDFEVARIGVRVAMAVLLVSYIYDTVIVVRKVGFGNWRT